MRAPEEPQGEEHDGNSARADDWRQAIIGEGEERREEVEEWKENTGADDQDEQGENEEGAFHQTSVAGTGSTFHLRTIDLRLRRPAYLLRW